MCESQNVYEPSARYASDATQGTRHQRVSSTNGLELPYCTVKCHNVIEYAEFRDPVSEEAGIHNSDKFRILLPKVDAGNKSPDFIEQDGKKWCVCLPVAYGGMGTCDSPERLYECFQFECMNLGNLNISRS